MLLAALASSVQAENTLPYERVGFVVSAEKEVENDVLTAILSASQTGQDSAKLADEVNQAIVWAMDIAKKQTAVDSLTLGYTTNPVYRDQRVDGWQVSQRIELKSKDSKTLSSLLGELQAKLRVESINYSISTEVQKTTEEQLINEALDGFKQRATQVQKNMGRANYRVVRLDIQTASDFQQPFPMAAASEGGSFSRSVAPPVLEAGKQKVRVMVNTEIELSVN